MVPALIGKGGWQVPVVLDERSKAGEAYKDAVGRLLGEQLEMRFVAPPRRNFVQRLLRRSA